MERCTVVHDVNPLEGWDLSYPIDSVCVRSVPTKFLDIGQRSCRVERAKKLIQHS